MTPALLTVLTFLAAVFVVAGLYSVFYDLVLRDRERVRQRLGEEFQRGPSSRGQKSPLFKDIAKLRAEAAAENADQETRWGRLLTLLDQSGLEWSPQKFFLVTAVAGGGLGAGVGLLSGSWLAGAGAALVGGAVPFLFVQYKRKKRLDKLLSQLPDALELIGRLVRAGQTISHAFQGVADEFQPPIATEFAYCYEQQNLGLSPDVALRDLGRRIGLVEMKIFVLAVLVQRQTGGNLAELIDNLANVVRERFRIKGKIRVLTAEGRMEAAVLLALPPVVFAMILFLNRNYALMLFDHPKVIYGTLALMLVGMLWIRRIINFDF